ncbi:MAG: hypothetical protein J7639_33070 [Paenibacillaceae bacterium]|nr:hypothetical protein [Paenibacillaceae bacterium]
MLLWMDADTEPKKEEVVLLLCRHTEALGVPYKWSTVLTMLYNAIGDKGLLIAVDDVGTARGVLAYGYAAGPDRRADLTRFEVYLLFVEAGYRGAKALRAAAEAFGERELERLEPIREVEFFAAPTAGRRRLFGRLAQLSATEEHPCGMLDCYVTTPERIREYAAGK